MVLEYANNEIFFKNFERCEKNSRDIKTSFLFLHSKQNEINAQKSALFLLKNLYHWRRPGLNKLNSDNKIGYRIFKIF